jgi:hypothetical protein
MADYRALAKKKFPNKGEFFFARERKHEELIFFVPFYGGVKKQLLRHIRMVNKMGYDAFAFELEGDLTSVFQLKLPITSNGKFGVKHQYANQIEFLLNALPGQKIVFSFSNPCASAIEAMARRHCEDTPAMICDSGPTNRFMQSAYELYTHEIKVPFLPLRLAMTPIVSMGWSPLLHKDVHTDLETFPDGFPLLSIRGWKDLLIPPTHIDEVFEPHKNLNWQKLALPEAEHLTGLRDYRKLYVETVTEWLEELESSIADRET